MHIKFNDATICVTVHTRIFDGVNIHCLNRQGNGRTESVSQTTYHRKQSCEIFNLFFIFYFTCFFLTIFPFLFKRELIIELGSQEFY